MHRQRHKIIPNQPQNRCEIVISNDYLLTQKNQQFVLIDTEDEQRIIIFGTRDFFIKMCSTESLYGDGTFYAVPKLFYQLYSLHGFYKDEMIGFVYILLPDKTEQTYIRMFRLIQDKAIELNLIFSPNYFHCDFEKAVIKTVNNLFPNCQVKGCLFHYSQAILRRFNFIFGKRNYLNEDLHKLVRRVSALPFVPIESVDDIWEEVMEQTDRNDLSIIEFLDYVTDTWIDTNAQFKKDIWNHYRNFKTRTNNHLEGFHNALNKKAGGSHKNFFQFVNLLKIQQEKFENKIIIILDGGLSAKKQQLKYRRINEKIGNLTNDFDDHSKTNLEFLDAISYCLSL